MGITATVQSSDIQLQQAFDAFSSAELAKTALFGEERVAYAAALRDTFEQYRSSEHGSLLCVRDILSLSSRTPYVGYAGDQALTIEMPADADDEMLGTGALQVLDASRQMMLDFLSGRLRALERDEGMAFHQTQMSDLSARCGFRNVAAMLKAARSVALTRAADTGVTTVSPLRRVKADYFEGMGADFDVGVPSGCGSAILGRSIREALAHCA